MRSTTIGKFVDSFYSNETEAGFPGLHRRIRSRDVSWMKGAKIRWRPIKYLFRHLPEGKHFKVRFKGRNLLLSGGHGVLRHSRTGELIAKPTDRLRVGDHIVISRRLPEQGERVPSSIGLLPHLDTAGLFLHGVPETRWRGCPV